MPATAAHETSVLKFRPSLALVLLHRQGWWLGPMIACFAAHATVKRIWSPDPAPWLVSIAVAWFFLGLGVRLLAWLARSYEITNRRLIVRAGLISRIGADIPLDRIQHTTTTASFAERIFGVGTIGIATAGADGPVVNLLMVSAPQRIIKTIRAAAGSSPNATPVIGLAGGIGAGKSEVARILRELGCLVIDSDREAKEALDRPEVRDQLVEWWGDRVLTPDGRVSRKALADIIFQNDKDRAALEALIHPLVKSRRAEIRRAAEANGAAAVVIDAPLLFEAGIDAECDTVIFVDAPRAARLSRVNATRGWDEAELARREKAQLPLEQKRRKSQFVVENDGTTESLRSHVEAVFRRIRAGSS